MKSFNVVGCLLAVAYLSTATIVYVKLY